MTHANEEAPQRNIFKAIAQKTAHIAILGSGYVGLPTAALFANAGFTVTAIDVQSDIVKSVNDGNSHINEPGLQKLVSRNVQAGKLKALLNNEATLKDEDVVIVSVQTPIDENKSPILSVLMNAIETVGKNLQNEMLVAVCSTIPPGTLLEKVMPMLESMTGLEADTDFYLAYVPERIAPGKALKEFVENPRLVGGIGPNSTKIAAELFRTVCKKIIETDAATAEIAKAAENTFRDVNIAFANQLALICEQHGADITKVIELANTHPRVNIHTPGPGVGGPCLTKDPYLLIHDAELKNRNIIITARKTNDYMPQHVVKMTQHSLKQTGKKIKNSKIAILGTAYKANVDDARYSPSEPLIKELTRLGAETIAYDPHCLITFGAKTATSLQEAVKGADCIIIVTDHTEFKNLNLTEIKQSMADKPVIIDGKRIVNPHEAEELGFTYYGVGYGKPRGPISKS
jgi:UDP-N-acetyl-D-mannosaminuronic acid dehydrogenase